MTYVPVDEAKEDIQKMLIVLRALTPKGTTGEDMLNEWIQKYHNDE